MAYSRSVEAPVLSEGPRLTSDLAAIGMVFHAPPSAEPNIEDTLLAATVEGMEGDDLRVLAVTTTWLGVHGSRVNADRLYRVLTKHRSARVRAYWAAIGVWLGKDRRLARLRSVRDDARVDLLRAGTGFHIGRKGEDPRFEGTALRVPAGVLRDRPSDVLSPEVLAAAHRTYRCRVLIGPSYRADMWAVLEGDPSLSAAQLARRTYGSFATAWNVKRDWAVVHPDRDKGTDAPGRDHARTRGANRASSRHSDDR